MSETTQERPGFSEDLERVGGERAAAAAESVNQDLEAIDYEIAGLRLALFAGIQHPNEDVRAAIWAILDDVHDCAAATPHAFRDSGDPVDRNALDATVCARCGEAKAEGAHT